MNFVLNGQSREFPQLGAGAHLQDLVAELGLKGDRVAIEHNGNIVPRAEWSQYGPDGGGPFGDCALCRRRALMRGLRTGAGLLLAHRLLGRARTASRGG